MLLKPAELRAAAARIRLLVLDVDGVMTDGRLHYDAEGREFKSFHVRDGHGLVRARKEGLQIAVISGRPSAASAGRMKDLGIPHVHLGILDKAPVFERLLAELKFRPEEVACVGDDEPDVPLLKRAGLAIVVADAHPCVHDLAHWRTTLPGGRGAVREVCDLLLEARR